MNNKKEPTFIEFCEQIQAPFQIAFDAYVRLFRIRQILDWIEPCLSRWMR